VKSFFFTHNSAWRHLDTLQIIHFLPSKRYEEAFNELLFALGLSIYFKPRKTKDEYVNEGKLHHKAKRYKEAVNYGFCFGISAV